MIRVKEYRVECKKNEENPFFNKLIDYCRKNKILAEIKPLYFENDNTLRVIVVCSDENHKKLKEAGFIQV